MRRSLREGDHLGNRNARMRSAGDPGAPGPVSMPRFENLGSSCRQRSYIERHKNVGSTMNGEMILLIVTKKVSVGQSSVPSVGIATT